MEYRYPKWSAYAVLIFPIAFIGFGIYGFVTDSANCSSLSSDAFIAVILTGATALSLLGYLYLSRHSIRLENDAMIVTGAFRTKSIPFSRIMQVLTTSTPRGGTTSLLVDEHDAVLGKLDGSLTGFGDLFTALGKKLRTYQTTFYRRDTWGHWEMQVAGDTHWVPCNRPGIVVTSTRRQGFILVVGCSLIAILLGFVTWLGH